MAGMVRSAIRPLLAVRSCSRCSAPERGRGAPPGARRGRCPAGPERAAERLVERLGGDVGDRIAIVDGFTARVPAAAIRACAARPRSAASPATRR